MIDKNDPRLTAYLLDELSAEQAAEIESAINDSPELQAQVEALRGTIGVLNRVCNTESGDALSAQQIASLEHAAGSKVVAPLADPDDGWAARIRWRNFAIAALVIYAVGMSLFALREPASMTALPQEGLVAPKSIPESGIELGETVASHDRRLTGDLTPGRVNMDSSPGPIRQGQARIETRTRVVDGREESYQVSVPTTESPARTVTVPEITDAPVADPFGGAPGDADLVGESLADAVDGTPLQETSDGLLSRVESRRNERSPEVRLQLRSMYGGHPPSDDPFAADDLGEADEMSMEGAGEMMGMGMADGMDMMEEMGDPFAAEPGDDAGGMMGGGADSFGLASPFGRPQPDANEDGAGVGGDRPNVEFTPENGQIVIRGSRADVDRVRRVIDQIETAGGEDAPESPREQTPDEVVDKQGSARGGQGFGDDVSNAELVDGQVKTETIQAEVIELLNILEGDEVQEGEQIAALVPKKKIAKPKPKTWKPATAATNRARLSVGHHDDLALAARDTYVRIDGFRARVFFDLYYYNDRPQQLEGQFMLRLPNDASLHYFAFGATPVPTIDVPPPAGKAPARRVISEANAAVKSLRQKTATTGSDLARRATDSNFTAQPNTLFAAVKSARVAPRQKAALAYSETVRRRVDPALVEWAGPGIFQTRVFPLLPNQLHRIIVGYDVMLRDDGNDRTFSLNLPAGEAGGRVEFDIAAAAGTAATITPEADAFVSGGRAYYRFVDAEPRDYKVRLSGTESVVLNTQGEHDAFFATRLMANLPDAEASADSSKAIFLLDTSWSDRPAAFSRRLKLMKQVLQQNPDSIKQFAVLMFNVEQRWWRREFVDNTPDNVAQFFRDANTLALEGATDLHSALAAATKPAWTKPADDAGAQPNFFLFSDASATWGKTDLASLADPLAKLDRSAGGGSLFAYHLAGHSSDKSTQQWLAEASGGAVFDVAEEAELELVSVAHRSRPWRIVKATARGTDEILIQGSSSTVYPNQPLVIAGRGNLKGPLKIVFARGKQKKTIEFQPKLNIASPAAARLYGQLAVERLEPYAENLAEVTVAFARYFRVPGRTCSMVMLEGPEDYQRYGVDVPPAEDRLVIASTLVASVIDEQELELLEQRENPRKRFVAWVDSLQSASMLNVSTALKLAMKRLPDSAFGFEAKPLVCKVWQQDQLRDHFLDELNLDAPGFAAVMREADRRREKFGADDALKAASTLVEAKPSDADTLRSVAFRAIEWQRSDQAAPLLWRLAQARPYQPQCLLLLARAAAESGDIDAAIVCYDLVSSGNWHQRWAAGVKDIAQMELLHVLEKVDSGEVESAFPQYARARLQQLRTKWCDEGMDVVVLMHWNTDRTDVDLHVMEPSGEECYYSHPQTKSGGRITQDITEGLGPEMYSLETAPVGSYRVDAKYFSADQNRTKAPTETLLTVVRNLGRPNTTLQTKRITLSGKDEKQTVMAFKIGK